MVEYTNDDNIIYKHTDINRIVDCLKDADLVVKQKRGREEKQIYYNFPSSFDIETSSWIDYNGEERAAMYCWQLGLNGHVMIGRKWEEFKETIKELSKLMDLKDGKKIIVYVHNLSFEMQFIEKLFSWKDIFYIDDRKVIKATTTSGIEFRCSYALSGKKLEDTAKDLRKYKVEKMTGDLDHSKIRNSKTVLSDDELKYCVNDVKVVMSYIQEKIENEGLINIPLTKTGYIRKMCKDALFGKGQQRKKYNSFMKKLKLTEEVYDMLKRAFNGGYVHCNPLYSNVELQDVSSYDFISSYPTTLVAHRLFPMSSPKLVKPKTKEEFEEYTKLNACLFDVTFHNIRLKEGQYCGPISKHKCFNTKCVIVDNNKVECAEKITTTITEQDWEVYKNFYDWDKFSIGKMYIFERGYLPTELIDVILNLYETKTKLKGICEGDPDLELEYALAKENLNSVYGMMVTDILKMYDSLEEYNNSFNRFLYYPWGVWTTAISRKALFAGINATGSDFVYCDTDCIKILNKNVHLSYLSKYNKYITKKLDDAMTYHGFDKNRTRPFNSKGEVKQIGIWDYECTYDRFKALRGKMYINCIDDKYELTVSGLQKDAIQYFDKCKDPIDAFDYGLTIKNIKTSHTYIDEKTSGYVTDYQGNKAKYEELGSIYIRKVDYTILTEEEEDLYNFMDAIKRSAV